MVENASQPDEGEVHDLTEEDLRIEDDCPILDGIIGRRPSFARAEGLQHRLDGIIAGCEDKRGFKAQEGVSAEGWGKLAIILARFLKAMEFRKGLYRIEELEEVERLAQAAKKILGLLEPHEQAEGVGSEAAATAYVRHILDDVALGIAGSPGRYALLTALLAQVAAIPEDTSYARTRRIAEGRSPRHRADEVGFIPSDRELRSQLQRDLDAWWLQNVGTSRKAVDGSGYALFLNEIVARMRVVPLPGISETAVREARRLTPTWPAFKGWSVAGDTDDI